VFVDEGRQPKTGDYSKAPAKAAAKGKAPARPKPSSKPKKPVARKPKAG
jgi:hypothetical protein